METKNCETCGKGFLINKWQTKKRYCSGPCTQGYYHSANKKRKKK